MAVQSIGSVINASFIRSFQGLAGSGGPTIGAGAGSSASIGTGLRLGARTFATAIQNLNATIGVVNVADDTLKQLTKLTDKMIDVAERGTSVSAGTTTRRGLQSEFEDLVVKFRRIVESSTLNSVDYLTQDGLVSLFKKIGLDKESSEGVAAIFRRFVKTTEDSNLVSESTKSRPAEVPVLKQSKVAKVSDSNVFNGVYSSGISPNYTVYQDTNGSGFNQPYHVDTTGTVTAQSGVTQQQTLLAVNETSSVIVSEKTGYSVVASTQNLTGDNPSNYNQAFLIDPDGSVVRQITQFSTAGVQIYASDISNDNRTAAIAYQDGVNNYVDVISVNDIYAAPGVSALERQVSLSDTPISVKISNDAQYIVYQDATLYSNIMQVGTSITDTYVSSNFADASNLQFLNSDTVAYAYNNNIYSYRYGSYNPVLIATDQNIQNFAVLENDNLFSQNDGSGSTSQVATIAYTTSSGGNNKLTVLGYDLDSGATKTRYRRNLGEGTVYGISLAYQDDLNLSRDRVDVGVLGSLSSLYGDSDTEMYRITESRFASNFSLFSQPSSDPSEILDGNVLTRADSYRLLGDLKALKKQMKDNTAALANAREYLANNISLARTAGFAFLDISNSIDGTEDATRVAQMVADEIRRNANGAQAAQVENLRNIASETVGLLSS